MCVVWAGGDEKSRDKVGVRVRVEKELFGKRVISGSGRNLLQVKLQAVFKVYPNCNSEDKGVCSLKCPPAVTRHDYHFSDWDTNPAT